MEIAQDLKQPKSTGKEGDVGLEVHESETKVSDIADPSLLSKELEEKVRQSDKNPGETTAVKVSNILERLRLNSEIGPEDPQITLDSTNYNLKPEYKELEADKKEEATSEGWAKKVLGKAWGKVAFSSPDNLYFKPNIIEKWGNGRIYELLGVKYFKRFYDWKYPEHKFRYSSFALKIQDRRLTLTDFEKNTRRLESLHVTTASIAELAIAPLFFLLPISGYIMTAVNYAYHFYPIITQRYNRIKVYNLIDKLNARERKNNK